MSKSEDSQYHAVYILDEPDVARKKIMRSVTDSGREIAFSDDPEKAGVNNLLTIYQGFTGKSREAIETHFSTARGYGDLKKEVAEVVVESLKPIQARYHELAVESNELDKILAEGAERAQVIANDTLQAVKDCMGFLPPLS